MTVQHQDRYHVPFAAGRALRRLFFQGFRIRGIPVIQGLAYFRYISSCLPVGQKPIISDPMKVFWKNMQKETINEAHYR